MKYLICILLVAMTTFNVNANTTTEPIITPEPISSNVTAFSGLKIRTAPGLKSQILKIIPFGESVNIIESDVSPSVIEWMEGHWTKVEYKGIEGYVFDGFLSELPIPRWNFELSQSDMDLTYPMLAWAENNFDQIREPDTLNRGNHDKIIQYMEHGIVLSREDSDYSFNTSIELPETTMSEAYNIMKSMLLSRAERALYDKSAIYIKDKEGNIKTIKINTDFPLMINKLKNGNIKISVSAFHTGCGL